MIEKILIPLENVSFRGADNKIRLRYRLISKDKNEFSQWSPIYTINPSELGDSSVGDNTTNPILYSGWDPTSSVDSKNVNIKLDSGWTNNKKMIPCKNFDVFISWNYGTASTLTSRWGYEISKSAKILSTGITTDFTSGAPYSEFYSYATVTDIPTKDLKIGDTIKAKPGSTATFGNESTDTSILKILNESSILIQTTAYVLPASSSIVAGDVGNVVKYGSSTPQYTYAGTSDSGQFAVNIPTQIYSTNKVIQYQYKITPATKPPTLNYIYTSSVLTTTPVITTTATTNTVDAIIDGGSPS